MSRTEATFAEPPRAPGIPGMEEPQLEMRADLMPVGVATRVPEPRKKPQLVLGVGASAQDLLDHWGATLFEVFGETAYHVGSSAMQKTGWRDVDVRMIMEDDKFEALFGKYHAGRTHAFWVAMMLSFSLWGQKVTGLPIDFQIVKRSDVTQEEWDNPRNPLGIFPSNAERPPWQRWEKSE